MYDEIVPGASGGRNKDSLEPESVSCFTYFLALRSVRPAHVTQIKGDHGEGAIGREIEDTTESDCENAQRSWQ